MAMKLYEHQCERPTCKYYWRSGIKRPEACPKCKDYGWDVPRDKNGNKIKKER
mgnify:CR=1 FL=1